jgi:hypothetical protein
LRFTLLAPDSLLTYHTHGYRVEVLHRIGRCQLMRAHHTAAEDVYIACCDSYKVTANSAALALTYLRDWLRIEQLYGQYWPLSEG